MFRLPGFLLTAWAACGLFVTVLALPGHAQQKLKGVQWTHAFDLACRKFGEEKFTKETQKFGVEAYRDNNDDLGVYVSQTGSLAIAGQGFAGLKVPLAKSAGPKWLTGLDLPARKAGAKAFTKETKVHSVEVFLDPNTNNWLYVTAKGDLATAEAKIKPAGGTGAPKWIHSVDLAVRKGGVKEWKNAAKFGVEIYRDGNTGNLIFICETGAVAITPDSGPLKGDAKAPDWLHGLDLSCRRHDEKVFTKETRKFGVEVFRDSATNQLIFIDETGAIAVTPAPSDVKAPTPNVKEPRWTHGLNVKSRTYGEKDFSDKTKVFGAEVFRDENVGVTLYISETGAIAAAPK